MKYRLDIGTFVCLKGTVKGSGEIGVVNSVPSKFNGYMVYMMNTKKNVYVGREYLGILRKHEIVRFLNLFS